MIVKEGAMCRQVEWESIKEKNTLSTPHQELNPNLPVTNDLVHCYSDAMDCVQPLMRVLVGAGYHLKLMKQDLCHTQKVTRLVQKQVPGSALKSDLGSELWYNLPCDQTGKFPALFDSLETNKERLGVCEMSVAVTTLEEVFIRNEKDKWVSAGSTTTAGYFCQKNHVYDKKLAISLVHEWLWSISKRGPLICCLSIPVVRSCIQQGYEPLLDVVCGWVRSFRVLCTVTSTILTTIMSGEHPPSSYVKEPALTLSLRYYNISTVPYSVMTGVPGLLVSTYRHLVGFEPIPPGESVSSLILDIGKENIKEYMNNIVIGAEFNTSKTRDIVVVNAMYGSTVHHAAPLSLNVINNALVKYLMASDEYSITTTNHPLPDLQLYSSQACGLVHLAMSLGSRARFSGVTLGIFSFKGNDPNSHQGLLPDLSSTPDIRTTIYWSLLVPLGLFFFLGFVIAFPLEEKVNKMKQLQIMAGVSPFYYWFICFLVDYFIYLLTSVLMVVSIYICDTLNIYKQSVELGVFFLMIVLYGLSGIPYAYIFTYFKKSATDGFCHYIFSSVLIGVTILYCSFVYKLLRWMKYLLWFLPHICLSRGLNMFSAQVVKNIRCKQLKDDKTSLCTLDPFHLCCSKSQQALKLYNTVMTTLSGFLEELRVGLTLNNSNKVVVVVGYNKGLCCCSLDVGDRQRFLCCDPILVSWLVILESNFDDSSSKRHFAYLEFPHENNENGIGLEVLFLALNSVLYVGLIMLAEYGVIHKIRKVFRKSQLSNIKSDCEMDEDVVKEQIRVKKHIHGKKPLFYKYQY
uniref:Uncharacterized protein n=1 Tax=Timema cristinae TaxID=61476 RepID=A0A7R9CY97_TIMCR|nr:unnamed protein product [Timema cristinae]